MAARTVRLICAHFIDRKACHFALLKEYDQLGWVWIDLRQVTGKTHLLACAHYYRPQRLPFCHRRWRSTFVGASVGVSVGVSVGAVVSTFVCVSARPTNTRQIGQSKQFCRRRCSLAHLSSDCSPVHVSDRSAAGQFLPKNLTGQRRSADILALHTVQLAKLTQQQQQALRRAVDGADV